MISYRFILSPEQPFNDESLSQIQRYLASFDAYIDLSWKDNLPWLSISIPENALSEEVLPEEVTSIPESEENAVVLMPGNSKRRGRPTVQPQNDLTLGRIRHMRFMGISLKVIAKEIGISKRTLYRRLDQINKKNISEDTPFSQWV